MVEPTKQKLCTQMRHGEIHP